MSEIINCPKCGRQMSLYFESTKVMMSSFPPVLFVTYVCHACKLKRNVPREIFFTEFPPNVDDYTEVSDEPRNKQWVK